MSATYAPDLPTDKDWVRLNIGDRNVPAKAVFQDEEIEATLAEEANKYLAAATLGESMLAIKTGGAVEKAVGDLRIRYSDSPQSAFRAHIQRLRTKGAALVMPKPRAWQILGSDC